MEQFDWELTLRPNIIKLKIVGLWPQEDTYKMNLYTLWSATSIFLFLYAHNFFQAFNIFFIFDDLQAITATIFVSLPEMLTVVKTVYVMQNMKILKQLIASINNDIFMPKNKRQLKLITPSLNFWKANNTLFWTMAAGTIFFWACYPILDKSVKDYKLPFLAWYPYNVKQSPLYEITYVYQIVSIAFVAATCLTIDILIAALNMYIGAQFDILCDDVRHLGDVNNSEQKFLDCMKHHKEILKYKFQGENEFKVLNFGYFFRFAKNSNKFFQWIVFFQFFISAISIGITMFQLTTVVPLSSEFFSVLAFGIAITVQIFMYCWFGNEVEIKSSKLPYAVFESNWLKVSLDMQKNINFFVLRCQKSQQMTAMNLFSLSVDTFVKILRTAWSYFALLHQVTSRN